MRIILSYSIIILLFFPWIFGWGNIASQNSEFAFDPLFSLLAIAFGATVAILLGKLFKRRKNIPHSIISILILALLLPYSRDLWVLGIEAFSGFIAILSAIFLRFFERPIFNPAALGAFLGEIFSNLLFPFFGVHSFFYIGWVFPGMQFSFFDAPVSEFFALSFPHSFFSFFLFLPVFFYGMWKFRKIWITGIFFFSFFLFNFFFGESFSLIGTIMISGTMLLFSSVMLGDPKTSPAFPKEQMVYGAFTGILLASVLHFHFFSLSYIEVLLIANAGFFFWLSKKHFLKFMP